MTSTLQSRMQELLEGAERGTQAALARAAKVKSSSVAGWINGKTKELSGPVLLRVAAFFNVKSEWLATGKGPKWRTADDEQFMADQVGESVTSGQQRTQSHSVQPNPQILAEAMKWVVFEEGPLVKKPDGILEPKYPYGALERMQRLSQIYALAVADGGTLSPITAQSLIDAARSRHNLGDVDSERREVASGRRAAK